MIKRNVNGGLMVIMAILVLAIPLAMAGCATYTNTDQGHDFIETSYKFLDSSASIYDRAMLSVQALHQKGHLNDDRVEKIRKIAGAYWAAYHAAVEALISYKRTRSADAQAKTETAIAETARLAGKLLGYIRPFIEEKGA